MRVDKTAQRFQTLNPDSFSVFTNWLISRESLRHSIFLFINLYMKLINKANG